MESTPSRPAIEEQPIVVKAIWSACRIAEAILGLRFGSQAQSRPWQTYMTDVLMAFLKKSQASSAASAEAQQGQTAAATATASGEADLHALLYGEEDEGGAQSTLHIDDDNLTHPNWNLATPTCVPRYQHYADSIAAVVEQALRGDGGGGSLHHEVRMLMGEDHFGLLPEGGTSGHGGKSQCKDCFCGAFGVALELLEPHMNKKERGNYNSLEHLHVVAVALLLACIAEHSVRGSLGDGHWDAARHGRDAMVTAECPSPVRTKIKALTRALAELRVKNGK